MASHADRLHHSHRSGISEQIFQKEKCGYKRRNFATSPLAVIIVELAAAVLKEARQWFQQFWLFQAALPLLAAKALHLCMPFMGSNDNSMINSLAWLMPFLGWASSELQSGIHSNAKSRLAEAV